MAKEHTDTKLLMKGLKKLALTLPFLFLSPYLITLAFMNQENFMLYLALPLGIAAGALAIYLGFKGINTIMKSIF